MSVYMTLSLIYLFYNVDLTWPQAAERYNSGMREREERKENENTVRSERSDLIKKAHNKEV